MVPQMEQLIDVIRNADDRRHNSLILNFDGTFEIPKEVALNIKKSYIIRFETFDAGNGYVGIKASEDKEFMTRLYERALEAWNDYKTNPNYKNIYTDYF